MQEKIVKFQAIAFDLLTALVDSWTLWTSVAGADELGRRWRATSLRIVTSTGVYQPYEETVRRAAAEVGLAPARADDLLARWSEIKPWPETPEILRRLRGHRLAIVTNCSQRLAEIAAAATGGSFEVIMSAERAGYYKTDPRAYLAGAKALGLAPADILFVAGSAHDVPGAGGAGMKVYWTNRQGLPVPAGAPMPLVNAPDLNALPQLLSG
ncbi:MAG TPA: HAD-IA family hydrolase [Stellaceae bacterium]|jgi:2-haloalkanoic acid dehalogenase type II|nr:HAD-IA family hydrolase [Stellaceae bacterium]